MTIFYLKKPNVSLFPILGNNFINLFADTPLDRFHKLSTAALFDFYYLALYRMLDMHVATYLITFWTKPQMAKKKRPGKSRHERALAREKLADVTKGVDFIVWLGITSLIVVNISERPFLANKAVPYVNRCSFLFFPWLFSAKFFHFGRTSI